VAVIVLNHKRVLRGNIRLARRAVNLREGLLPRLTVDPADHREDSQVGHTRPMGRVQRDNMRCTKVDRLKRTSSDPREDTLWRISLPPNRTNTSARGLPLAIITLHRPNIVDRMDYLVPPLAPLLPPRPHLPLRPRLLMLAHRRNLVRRRLPTWESKAQRSKRTIALSCDYFRITSPLSLAHLLFSLFDIKSFLIYLHSRKHILLCSPSFKLGPHTFFPQV